MREFCYTPLDIAAILNSMELGCKEESRLLDLIWEFERDLLDPEYRYDHRKFILKTLYWLHYFFDKPMIDAEFPIVQKDLWLSQGTLSKEDYISDYLGLDLFFKSIRIRILYNEQRKYVRIKLRSLLKQYGYRRRSPQLMQYIDNCLIFYQLQPYLRGGEVCDIRNISLNDMIIFRKI